jgi:hypothetical protein
MPDKAIKEFTIEVTASDIADNDRLAIADTSNPNDDAYVQLGSVRFYARSEAIIRLAANFTLQNSTAMQKLFSVSGAPNGALSLPTGTYLFECVVSISNMSATSGNGQFSILGAGTATIANPLWYSVGVDGATGTAANQTGSTNVSTASPANQQTAGTATVWSFYNRGTFEVTAAGTIVPSVALATAAAAIVQAGSYFRIQRLGPTGALAIGAWS